MYQILVLFLVCCMMGTAEDLNTTKITLPEADIEEYSENNEMTELCQLPPYPNHGGYIVLDEKDAKPGDVFVNVSLVRFTTDENCKTYEIKRLTCSLGEWYQDILKYQSTTLQFYTSWCPFFCSCFFGNRQTGNTSSNKKGNSQKTDNRTSTTAEGNSNESDASPTSCRLPPYPGRGTYTVLNHPNAKPGDVFRDVSLTQYASDEYDTAVEIEHFECFEGTWHQKIFRVAAEKLHFHTGWCPTLCSGFFDAKSGFPAYEFLKQMDQRPIKRNFCVLPPYPKFGKYSILSMAELGIPGNDYDVLRLNYTCETDYTITGNTNLYCLNGTWSAELPKCTKVCKLIRQAGVKYLCVGSKADGDLRPCKDVEPDGSTIYPQCSRPYYKTKSSLKPMICVNGEWNNIAKCEPVCGLRLQNERRSETDARIKAPWNVAVYSTTSEPYKHICGGSIVAPNLIISVAECFYDNLGKSKSASEFIVAAGKLYRSFYDPKDDKTQISNVNEIKIPPGFFSEITSYQDDIALVFLSTPFLFNDYVLPVCVDFDASFDKIQLQEGTVGQVAGWDRSEKKASNVLRVIELPIISINLCFDSKHVDYDKYITGDKTCGGYKNGTALCNEDSGGGFAVAAIDRSDRRRHYYFLRGIVSGYHSHLCKEFPFTTLTMVSSHKHFITSNSEGLFS